MEINQELDEWWENAHEQRNIKWLTGHWLAQYLEYFKVHEEFRNAKSILEIGVGSGNAVKGMLAHDKAVSCVDISEIALEKLKPFVHETYNVTKMSKIPAQSIDLAFSVTVTQHIDDKMLDHHLKYAIRSLKKDGIFCMQFSECEGKRDRMIKKPMEAQKHGGWSRTPEEMKQIIENQNGKVISCTNTMSGADWAWFAAKIIPKDSSR